MGSDYKCRHCGGPAQPMCFCSTKCAEAQRVIDARNNMSAEEKQAAEADRAVRIRALAGVRLMMRLSHGLHLLDGDYEAALLDSAHVVDAIDALPVPERKE